MATRTTDSRQGALAGETPARSSTHALGLRAPTPHRELLGRIGADEALAEPGRGLDPGTLELMSSRFGHDFSGVLLHTGARAARSASALQARAYTLGSHIVFGAGQYEPQTQTGRHLLAHELAHVAQQPDSSQVAAKLELGATDAPAEREAERAADQLVHGEGPVEITRQAPGLRRAPAAGAGADPFAGLTLGGPPRITVRAVGRFREVAAPQSPVGRTALLVNGIGEVIGQQLPGGVFRFHDGNELRAEGEPLAAEGLPIHQAIRSTRATGLNFLEISDYAMASDGSFTATYEFGGDKAAPGAAFIAPGSGQDPLLPVSLRDSVGSPEYYQLRIADFKRRNPDKQPPDYYLQYGDKYLHRFLGKLPKLSPKGQQWLKSTLKNLQRLIEDKRDRDPAGYARLELDSDAATDFYYDTHPEAYIVSGLAGLPVSDIGEIASTPDQDDLLSYRGILQVVKVALIVGPRGENAPDHYGGPRP